MSTMVEATLPVDQFALSETLAEYPSVEFDILRLVANGTDRAMPFLWASGEGLDDLPAVLEADPSTENVEVVAELEEEYLLRMDWRANIRVILYIILEENATIIDATGSSESWLFRILFPEHDAVSATHEFCTEYEVDLEFERIYQLSDSIRRGQYGLSEGQYETIVRAYRNGYYEVPRETGLKQLAEHTDVTHQSLSERLRRGHETLIANTLSPEFVSVPDS